MPLLPRPLAALALTVSALLAPLASLAQDPAPTAQPAPEEISALRGRVLLNGLWRFQPATLGSTERPDADDWGLIPVPGAWMRQGWSHGQGPLPGVVSKGTGPAWAKVDASLGRAWYERELTVPTEWAGRRVTLSFQRVSTDATVFLDNHPVGTIEWPAGEVDLTAHVTPGSTHTLRVLVVATGDPGESIVWMGTTPGQNHVVKSKLPSAGLIGEVALLSRPAGPVVSDVFVQPSVRRGELALDLEFTGFAAGESLRAEVAVHRWDPATGRAEPAAEKTFPPAAVAAPSFLATPDTPWRHTLAFPWADARRWDLDQPNLYVAHVRVRRADGTIADDQAQRFGFREFWVEGRDLVLNGTPFRLRPFVTEMGREPITLETIDGFIAGLRHAGFNISQQWANNHDVRGSLFAQRAWMAERADELGWPLIGTAQSVGASVFDARWRVIWENPGVKERYRARLEQEMRTMRNHPSILVWGTSANLFNHAQDQNPRSIGRRDFAPDLGRRPQDRAGAEAFAWLKQLDPTRPFFTHAGNAMGDIYTANTYLNHIPLQEREEWLSAWARDGQMPYLAVEFGNPLFTDFLRGRDAFARAAVTEPLATEFAAALLGPDAYRSEHPAYRRAIRMQHSGGDAWNNWHANLGVLARDPNVQAYQAALMTGTWRAWRTAGITGGMVPWNLLDNSLFDTDLAPAAPTPPPAPGQRFAWEAQPWVQALTLFDPARGWTARPAGEALLAVNGPTLAWIAGAGDHLDFYEKQHSYRPGDSIAKQAALLNDHRTPIAYTARVRALQGDTELFTRDWSGTLAPAQTLLLPIAFSAPVVFTKTDLRLELSATLGDRAHRDTFALRVFPAVSPASPTPALAVYDPAGLTTAMLRALDIPFASLDDLGKLPEPGDALVLVGRDALATDAPTTDPLLAHIRAGGRVLLATQQPDWLRSQLGLRVSRFLTRRAWPVNPAHPLFAGLDAEDLRDWAGESTLIEPRPRYTGPIPAHGWRWGGRGAVSSAAIEKPHRSGWRPLLQAEFDLAYSPLLERELGAGRVLLSTLDFEDHAVRDPAAAQLLRQLLDYAAAPAAHTPARQTLYLGGDSGAEFLTSLALRFERAATLPARSAGLLAIIGEDAKLSPASLDAFANAGGRVLVLPRTRPLEEKQTHHGAVLEMRRGVAPGLSPLPPRPEFAGLDVADLRVRSELDARLVTAANGIAPHADGLLGLRPSGKGVIVYAQLAPHTLDVEARPWLRFTRWRHTRALAQLAANLGASFATDERLLRPDLRSVPLVGEWRHVVTHTLPAAPKAEAAHADPGISPAALALLQQPAGGEPIVLPAALPAFAEADGEAVAWFEFFLPASWKDERALLSLGRLDDLDTVYVNGQPVGSTADAEKGWSIEREYRTPVGLLRPGRNVIAVRLWDRFGEGGFTSSPQLLALTRLTIATDLQALYHPDHRTDFPLGDEPARYYRW